MQKLNANSAKRGKVSKVVVVIIRLSARFFELAPGVKDNDGDASIEGTITAVGFESLL
jgi:hypothetical protein